MPILGSIVARRVQLQDSVEHAELAPLYRASKVHALPSWSETTGLVSLEAALCGCNIVTTDRGYTRDYFGDMAWYCDPYDNRSIRRAVEAAHACAGVSEVAGPCARKLHLGTYGC